MAKEQIIDLEKFNPGFYALKDTTKAPFGSFRVMKNAQVTDRGGISPRPGIEVLGIYDASASKVRGLYKYQRSFGTNEILIRAYSTKLEGLSKDHLSSGWFIIYDGFTADKEFGFTTSLVNSDNTDYLVGCNRFEDQFRWSGAITQLNGALSGSETEVVVDSVLDDDVFYIGSVDSSTATTLTIASTDFANDQWNDFWVYITSGTHVGKIRKVTATTGDTLTFATLGSALSASDTFEIKKLAFKESGSIIYNGTEITYTTLQEYNKFPVSSAHAASDDAIVTQALEFFPANPRGNRFTNYLGRIINGNVRSGLARDDGGALQGYAAGGSVFVSKLNDPFDYSYSASRVAGEGDIISTPYGGGEITDVQHQEDEAYIFKPEYIEAIKYSQDANDVVVRTPLKAGIGSAGKTIKGSDDVYFITADKKFTTIGRVKAKDLKPETENVGHKIKRFLDKAGIDDIGQGIESGDKVYVPLKSDENQTDNNTLLIYNKHEKGFFEGVWDISAYGLVRFNGDLCFAESNGINIYKISEEHADIYDGNRYPIYSEVASHFFNLTPSDSNLQAMSSIYLEGYIRGGTTILFKIWKGFADDPFLTINFSADEDGLLDGKETTAFLGGSPLAIDPMAATFSEPGEDGRRHFSFRVYFPFQYDNHFSVGHSSNAADDDYEITRYGLGLKEDVSVNKNKIKSV